MKKKKKKLSRENNPNYIHLYNNVKKYNDCIWKLSNDVEYNSIHTNSWFNIDLYQSSNANIHTGNINYPKEKKIEYRKSFPVVLKLTSNQQKIMKRWMMAYIHMYNLTLKYIKEQYSKTDEVCLNYKILRTYHLKEGRNILIKKSQYPGFLNDTTIKTHIMDSAIRLACANYKSALSNFKAGNIKQFRIRYWKFRKPYDVLDIEPAYFKENSICPKIFGKIKAYRDNEEFNLNDIPTKYKSECKLIYERYKNRYTLYVPEKIEPVLQEHNKDIIILDPGIRTFMTGLSENEVLKIGTNINDHIIPYIKKIDKIQGDKKASLLTHKEKKIQKRCYIKIKNKVTDMQWKIIKYLTDHYKNILVGDMSVKGITNNEISVLGKMTKRVGYNLCFYKFRERLKYKCQIKNSKCLIVNEYYTTKMCSNCGYYKENLKGEKIFDCEKCKMKIDRDINGCRGIYLKSLK